MNIINFNFLDKFIANTANYKKMQKIDFILQ